MGKRTGNINSSWEGAGAPPAHPPLWWRRLKDLVVPPRSQRFLPTVTGYLLIAVSVALCIAAYNTGSNILFISLSLILAALLLSGALSWINFREVCWRLHADPPFRAGERCTVLVEVVNGKRFLPSYSFWFKIRAAGSREQGHLFLERRLDPGAADVLKWFFTPANRGLEKVTLSGAVSEFPFGFLRKSLGRRLTLELLVWPNRILYEPRESARSREISVTGSSAWRVGQGEDLVNLRDYHQGDSQRLIHWKASARMRRLQVRQFAAENQSGYFLIVQTSRKMWREEERFERLCRFVFSLAEDLFQENRILGAAIDDRPAIYLQRYVDLASFFDQLATLRMSDRDRHVELPLKDNLVTFEPYGGSGIHACSGGESIASA